MSLPPTDTLIIGNSSFLKIDQGALTIKPTLEEFPDQTSFSTSGVVLDTIKPRGSKKISISSPHLTGRSESCVIWRPPLGSICVRQFCNCRVLTYLVNKHLD